MAVKLEMLRCFYHVAQSGNLAEAARQLGRTQSALSMTLRQLEDHLGARLFEGERKSQLTPLGQQVFERAKAQVQAFDGTVREIESFASAPQGLLRIAAIPSVAGRLVPKAVGALLATHPGLKVDIRDMDSGLVIDAVLHGRADVGIASGRPVLNGVETRPLFQDAFGMVCAPGHALASGLGKVTWSEMAGHGFVGNSLCAGIDTPEMRRAMAETPVQAHNVFSLVGLLHTARWFTILPKTVVDGLRTDLRFRPIDGLHALRTVSLLIPNRTGKSGFVDAFADAVTPRP